MAKKQNYGFKTPQRRITKNITGFKVGGELSGGECKIVKSNKILIDKTFEYQYVVSLENVTKLFNQDVAIFAVGGYFYATTDFELGFEINFREYNISNSNIIASGQFSKKGLELKIPFEELATNEEVTLKISIKGNDNFELHYALLQFGFIQYDYFQNNDVYLDFNNSKKTICFPEQFYFFEEQKFPNSAIGMPVVLKSCNRCQRFLPINHFNERIHLAFTNHCSTKAPCTHGNFSNYEIIENQLTDIELSHFFAQNNVLTLKDNFVYSYYGHQLECKACKKFYVNSQLNQLRTSSQHREDSLRRRAFETLIMKLLNAEWIYHTYRISKNKEFDKSIWEKFDKKCFKCKTDLATSNDMDLDHTMPLAFLYNLDETATCLCGSCNSSKSDSFPVDFYTETELIELSKITTIPLNILKSRKPNQKVVDLLQKNIIWFFDDFLTFDEFHKERDGKKAVDSILHSLQKVVNLSETSFNLLEEYEKAKSI